MQLILQGKIITPIVSKKTEFFLKECKAKIEKPRRRIFSKITVGKPMFPFSYVTYLGNIRIQYKCKTKTQARSKLRKLLKIKSIGRLTCEGLGRIQWKKGYIERSKTLKLVEKQKFKVRIRKGLPNQLPVNVQQLIQYALLHDFYHSTIHNSKIYHEPELYDLEFKELLRKHHEILKNPLIQTFQHYDRLAAQITRKIHSPRTSRYNWYATEMIDFQKLAHEIAAVANHPWKLYEYIYQSKPLGHLNESLHYGYSSLRNHLLVIANLIVQDFLKKRLEKLKHKIESECRCSHI